MEKALDNLDIKNYEYEEKLYHYRNLFNDVETSITLLLCETKDKNIIKKYESIVSKEMKGLEVYSDNNLLRLNELKRELYNLVYSKL